MEGRTRKRKPGQKGFRVGEWVRVAGSRRRARIERFYADIRGGVRLDREIGGFKSWNVEDLRKLAPPGRKSCRAKAKG